MTDWEKHYKDCDTPWEKGAPSPGLLDFLERHPDCRSGCILVPGCGFGHDARALATAGFSVTGMDLAPSAVVAAQELTSPTLPIAFRAGDFLHDPPFQTFDWIFEHTLFCAIDPLQRDNYVKAVLRWLKPNGQYLAINYFIPDKEGPPFGTDREEQLARFTPEFDLLTDYVPPSYPNRVGLERLFWWKRKSGSALATGQESIDSPRRANG